MTISLQSDLNKLLKPTEIDELNQNIRDNQPILQKLDAMTMYERRDEYRIPLISENKGITKDIISNMSLLLFHKTFYVRDSKPPAPPTLCKKSKPPIIIFKPYIPPKKKNNKKYAEYMVLTLLAYKPFTKRNDITSLSIQDLEKEFNQFITSDTCPFYVKNRYLKANEKRQYKKKNKEKDLATNHEEIQDAQMESSSNESDFEYEEQRNQQPESEYNHQQNEPDQLPQIAKFTEEYQEHGHMAPRGLDCEVSDFGDADEDKDTAEEIRGLDGKGDYIHDPSKESWLPIYPELLDLAFKAEETIKQKMGLRNTSQYLNPNDLDPTQSLFVDTILDWEKQCIECKKDLNHSPPP